MKPMPRRDMCYFVGRRASMLPPNDAARAWMMLARSVEGMAELDVPKFLGLLAAIRAATIAARATREKNAQAMADRQWMKDRLTDIMNLSQEACLSFEAQSFRATELAQEGLRGKP
jgi:hypothetical protein